MPMFAVQPARSRRLTGMRFKRSSRGMGCPPNVFFRPAAPWRERAVPPARAAWKKHNWEERMNRLVLSLGAAASLLVALPAHAQDAGIEVMHYFTSGGEAAAINALKESFESAGGKWTDTPVAGGGGEAHDQALKARVLAGNPPGAAMPKLRDAQSWAQDGYLIDLEDVAKAERWDEIYPDAIKEAAKTDGKWSAV